MDQELTEEACVSSHQSTKALKSSSTLEKSSEMTVDEALIESGFGRFQYVSFLLLAGIQTLIGLQIVLSYFIVYDPPWKCIRNDTSQFCMNNFGVEIGAGDRKFSARCNLGREEWTYCTHTTYSIVTEFDLVCEKSATAAFISSVLHVGSAIGFFISGFAADYYGRKYVLVACLCVLTVSSIGSSYASSIWQLIISRAFIGAGYNSSYNISYVYLSETVPPKYRMIVGVGYCMGFCISEFLIDLVAYFCRYWRKIVCYCSLPPIIGTICIFFLPESPRWLIVHEKKSEAEKILNKIASFNKNPLGQFSIKSSIKSNDKKYSYRHLFKTKKIAFLTISVGLMWLTSAMAYYTIAFESSSLGGDMYQAFAFTTLAEIPSKFVACYVCDRFGRKKSILISLFFTGTFASSTVLIPKGYSSKYLMNVVLMMFARFFADINIQGVYIWASELFPTVVRLQGIGVCTIFERAGTFAAPFLANVILPINANLPHVILICFVVLSGSLGFILLPETNNQPTRERYEDFFCTTGTEIEAQVVTNQYNE